jgi:hypothetical protein
MWRVRVTIVAVEKQQVLHTLCVCSLSYPACKAHAPYYIVICGLWLHQIFRHYLLNGTIFGKTLLNMKGVLFIYSFNLKHLSF